MNVSIDIDKVEAVLRAAAQPETRLAWDRGFNAGLEVACQVLRNAGYFATNAVRIERLAALADVEPWTPSIDADYPR